MMPSPGDSSYQLDHTSEFKKQARELGKKAAARGISEAYVRALKRIVAQLSTRPLDWGDPERKTKKQGGWVYHGAEPPLIVYYAVYEHEKAVCLLKIKPLPSSPLE
jgi:hypothetical protein